MPSPDPLVAVADELYALPAGEFTAARDAAAKAAEDRELGKRIKALRKPTVAAWALNLLVRPGERADRPGAQPRRIAARGRGGHGRR